MSTSRKATKKSATPIATLESRPSIVGLPPAAEGGGRGVALQHHDAVAHDHGS